ncbi:unnamed protein product [Linum trigynum]|uniref:Myb/SANT-like domain-containing protein n=1 Tax=Linum trigynum TaxID=586398 RepID=A0AAV2FXL5_9ROSI
MMEKKVPRCGLKAKPTIQNRFKKLKHWFHSTVMMRGLSGFGWDPVQECINADKAVWDIFIAQNPTCKSYKGLPFPQFDDLAPVFANGRATGSGVISGNDPDINVDASDSGSEDDEDHPLFMDGMVPPATDEDMFNIINEGLAEKNQNQKKRPAKTTHGGSSKKKKGPEAPSDDNGPEMSNEMALMRPLIKESFDTIARALGESDEHDKMRKELMTNLAKLEGLTQLQKVQGFRRLNATPSDLKSFYELDEGNRLTLVLDLLSN